MCGVTHFCELRRTDSPRIWEGASCEPVPAAGPGRGAKIEGAGLPDAGGADNILNLLCGADTALRLANPLGCVCNGRVSGLESKDP